MLALVQTRDRDRDRVEAFLRRNAISVNVSAENAAAIRCYRALGFDAAATYEEWRFR